MSGLGWFFLLVAAVTLLAAFRVVTSPKIMHAAFWLVLSLLGVAVTFLLLDADFLAAVQVLIYIGAITTMIIFGVMLSDVEELAGTAGRAPGRSVLSARRGIPALLAAGGFSLAMYAIYRRVAWPSLPAGAVSDTPAAIGEALFTKYVAPFEIASVLLLVALIGAIVLSMREEAR